MDSHEASKVALGSLLVGKDLNNIKIASPFPSRLVNWTAPCSTLFCHPAGALNEQVVLLTNDERSPEVPLDVEGQVVADLTVSPASLMMGILQPGQKATKQVVIKAKQPFKILGIECDDPSFQAKIPTDARPMHMLPITFTASDSVGKVDQRIRVITDMGDAVIAEFSAYAKVVAPAPSTTPTNEPRVETPLTQAKK